MVNRAEKIKEAKLAELVNEITSLKNTLKHLENIKQYFNNKLENKFDLYSMMKGGWFETKM
jgi:uncharacterized protein YlxW (UPF0749 family)